MTEPDPLIEQLALLDPVRVDRAPEPGSTRHTEILERAMTNATTTTEATAVTAVTDVHHGRRRPRRRTFVALGAAAALLVIVAGFVVFDGGGSLSPAAALIRAGETTGKVLTLRSEYIQDDGNGGFNVVRSEHRGDDLRRTFSKIEPNGTERTKAEDEEYVVYIGDQGWTTTDGPTTVTPDERNAPYAESSAAIVEAAVTESTVTEIGSDDVRGVEATHYRIELDDAAIARLGRLRPNQLSAFELENPGMVRSLDVWIADDYIRRIRVTQTFEKPDSLGTTVEFYDFGADITIAPPN